MPPLLHHLLHSVRFRSQPDALITNSAHFASLHDRLASIGLFIFKNVLSIVTQLSSVSFTKGNAALAAVQPVSAGCGGAQLRHSLARSLARST